ncbi:MAG: chorismate synthase [Treponema sp.]|nr:chorismate synthase [Treponema sp.]
MSSSLGQKLKVHVFGQSHSRGLGVVMDGFPAGEEIDMDRVRAFLLRRSGGKEKGAHSTAREESDEPEILSGLLGSKTCGAPLCAIFANDDARGEDYENLSLVPRPSHADYAAFVKHGGQNDRRGGGHFSGRLTLPLCFAGAVCLQALERKGVSVDARIASIENINDDPFDWESAKKFYSDDFPTASREASEKMRRAIEEAAAQGDSVGGTIECCVRGLRAGLGSPFFDTVEGRLAQALFAIPAVKGVEFGAGFGAAAMRGSACNDPFFMEEGRIKTRANNSGGAQGGLTNGMPVVFRTAFKPTPSILIPQESLRLDDGTSVTAHIKGRHDSCVVPRALPAVIAAAAIVALDLILEEEGSRFYDR